jgi:hypothetical protein
MQLHRTAAFMISYWEPDHQISHEILTEFEPCCRAITAPPLVRLLTTGLRTGATSFCKRTTDCWTTGWLNFRPPRSSLTTSSTASDGFICYPLRKELSRITLQRPLMMPGCGLPRNMQTSPKLISGRRSSPPSINRPLRSIVSIESKLS